MYKFTVILNIAATVWLLTPRGPELTVHFLKNTSEVLKRLDKDKN